MASVAGTVNTAPFFALYHTGRAIADTGHSEIAQAIAVQSDGRIVVAGYSDGDFLVLRYQPDGLPDTGFGAGGAVFTDFGGGEVAEGIAIQADGRIVAAGFAISQAVLIQQFALARYRQDGTLDTAFDGDGKVTTQFPHSSVGTALAVQSDGRIVVAGLASTGSTSSPLVRFNADGSVDTAFGTAGV